VSVSSVVMPLNIPFHILPDVELVLNLNFMELTPPPKDPLELLS
jgi:hypothetical protein